MTPELKIAVDMAIKLINEGHVPKAAKKIASKHCGYKPMSHIGRELEKMYPNVGTI